MYVQVEVLTTQLLEVCVSLLFLLVAVDVSDSPALIV